MGSKTVKSIGRRAKNKDISNTGETDNSNRFWACVAAKLKKNRQGGNRYGYRVSLLHDGNNRKGGRLQ